jgi:ankyrin repeat protein
MNTASTQEVKDNALFRAVEDDSLVAIAGQLIASGANVNAMRTDGVSPLHHACYHGNVNMVKLLVANGSQVDKTTAGFPFTTPLHWVCGGGPVCNVELVKSLLAAGADVHTASFDGCTPLLFAAQDGQRDVVSVLIAGGLTSTSHASTTVALRCLKQRTKVTWTFYRFSSQREPTLTRRRQPVKLR